MTVQELINELKGMDPDANVHFSYNYGDYWRTTVAPKVRTVEEAAVKWSDYHRMPKLVTDDDDDDEKAVDAVVVLS